MNLRRTFRLPLAGATMGLFLALVACPSFAEDPPPISSPVTKCGAKLEYLSRVKSTGQQPAYQLTNSIRNIGQKTVTDLEWPKPDLSTPELKANEVLEESYGISAYIYDKDAPIKFWYQGCEAPAEAYLRKEEKEKTFSLHSILRRYSATTHEEIATANVIVTKNPEYIQFEITREPADAQVGLTAISAWVKVDPKMVPAVEASTKEFGYSLMFAPTIKVIGFEPLKSMHAEWGSELALFTRRTSGDRNYVRVRLPAKTADVHIAHGKIILLGSDGKLIATGSYATFAPGK